MAKSGRNQKKKYHIITYGCQMNKSDSQRIAYFLEQRKYGQEYGPAKNINQAGLLIVNMCSVRQQAVDRVYGKIKGLLLLKKTNPGLKIVLTGCVLKEDKTYFEKIFDEIWSKEDIYSYFSAQKQVLKYIPLKKVLTLNQNKKKDKIAYVPISNGCNNFCAYCVVPFTRGKLICRSHKEILKEIKLFARNKPEEIWLLGQNVNDYCSPCDPKIGFVELLEKATQIKGDFKIRFTSPHPKNFTDKLIDTIARFPKIAKYTNLPLQSGSNEILKKMNRAYTAEDYKALVKKIRKKIPDINISTDVIIGFPGETKKRFQETVKLFKEIRFNLAYIAKYSPRKGTSAFALKDNVTIQAKKQREKILRKIVEENKPQNIKPLSETKKSSAKAKNNPLPMAIVILGPTASGKTELSIKIAKWLNSKSSRKKFGIAGAEIISADSRQVYKGMDIGTGKITKKEMQGIPHHLLDVISPKTRFSAGQYKHLAQNALKQIQKQNKIPIIVGGTGFYINAITDNISIPEIKPDLKLRKELEKKTLVQLAALLEKKDPQRAQTIDKNNPRRLIRALEIILKSKKPVPLLSKNPELNALFLGIKKKPQELKKAIRKRLRKRLRKGMLKEVQNLKNPKVSWKRLESFGLEYKYLALYLQRKMNFKEMVSALEKEIEKFSKRQMTWFKKEPKIKWIKTASQAKKLIQDFL